MAYTITFVDEKNNKTTKTGPGQKVFYSENEKRQVKRGYYEDSSHQKRMVYQYDIVPPTLTVDNPKGTSSSNPTYIGTSSYTVTGTVSDTESGVASVTVNGNNAAISGNKYSCTLKGISSTATTTVKVVAKDMAGNSTTITRYLRYDAQKPVIEINSLGTYDSSLNSYVTFNNSITVSGRVYDTLSGIASLTVQGAGTSLVGNNFSSIINLSTGRTGIKVIAKDKVGNNSESVVYVTKKDVPSGFSTNMICNYYHHESQMDYVSNDSGSFAVDSNDYFDHVFKGSCGGFQHPGYIQFAIQKLITPGQNRLHLIATADGGAQHTGYKGGYEYLQVEIYDYNGQYANTLYSHKNSIIYVTSPTYIDTYIDISHCNGGTYFIRISGKIGNVAGGEWANYNGNVRLSFER